MADPTGPELVASFFTLSGGGFVDPPRHGFVQRCEAAAGAGFAGIGLHIADLARTVDSGVSISDMQAVLRDTGLRLVEIEFLGGWAFDVDDAALDESISTVEVIADAFGGRHLSTGEFRTPPAGFDLDTAAATMRSAAGRLSERDLILAVEAFPWSAIGSLDVATELIRRSGATNAGLLIDVWHFYNTGSTVEQLSDLPGAGVAAVQLNDGPRVYEDFITHARAARKLPGGGDLDVVGLIRAVQRAGFRGPYSVEVNTPELRALPVNEVAAMAFEASTAVLRAAGR